MAGSEGNTGPELMTVVMRFSNGAGIGQQTEQPRDVNLPLLPARGMNARIKSDGAIPVRLRWSARRRRRGRQITPVLKQTAQREGQATPGCR